MELELAKRVIYRTTTSNMRYANFKGLCVVFYYTYIVGAWQLFMINF